MRTIELPKLPKEVCALIADGVYGLYRISMPGASYVLTAARSEFYFLSEEGLLVPAPSAVHSLAM